MTRRAKLNALHLLYLERSVFLFTTMDGTLTIGEPLFAGIDEPTGYQTDDAQKARDTALDAFLEGKPDEARAILDDIVIRDDKEAISLPVFSTDTPHEAEMVRTVFCRLAHDKLPDGSHRYVLKDFHGSLEGLRLASEQMERFYQKAFYGR